jgi:hypothetical protein
MADSKRVKKLDDKLMENQIIDPSYKADYKKVHTMLNTHVRKNGEILSEESFKMGRNALKTWLMLLYKKGASQEKLTSYLRCGLAHICFDYVESTYHSIGIDELITRALQSFKKRKFHKAYFKVSTSEINALKTKKTAAKKRALKKVKSIKKKKGSSTKPVKKKKAIKKKSSNKKNTRRPSLTKKSAKKK